MAAATGILLLLIFPVVTPDSSSDLLQTVIGALEKMVHYYKENYMDLNIDGLFGLRVLEGHMESILQEYASGKHKNLSIENVNRIKKMLTEATQVCKDAIEFVKRDDEEYYNTMSYVIGQPWSYFLKHKQVEPDLRWHPETYLQHKTRILDETTSDNCMSELIGSQSKEKCKISEKCAKIMTTKGLSGYGITHQILWTMLADQAGCGSAVEEVFQMHEFVCPSLGYYQFLSKKYLEDILTWQNLNGCFGEFPLLEKSNIGQKPVQLSLSQKLLKAANGTRVQDIAPGNSLTANNMKTIQQKDIYRKSNILLNKLKADSKPGTIDEKVLKHVTVNIDQFPKVVKSPTSNISLKQNGNVVIQAGGNLIGKFQDNKNLGSDIGLNQGLNFGMDKNQISQRKLLSVSSSMFDSVNRHQFSNLGFKKRNLLAEKRMKDGDKMTISTDIGFEIKVDIVDGCLAHKTAVAAGALMMYLRYILDPGPLNLRTDPEEFRQRFLMSNEFNDKVRSDTNVINKRELNTDKGTDKEKQVTGKSRRHKHDGVKEGALNNNILAAQLHGMDREGGNYYQDDGDYKEKGYENEICVYGWYMLTLKNSLKKSIKSSQYHKLIGKANRVLQQHSLIIYATPA
ncbi:hypothetical protein KUTeg_013367 [Tegillarca granosa]|uniref:Uncharacterized protein n=1 Tax=Tegillarca granosa TaxID=220873 RepID=A0ABQ9ETH5_TEGGR|nr:hypothetical protein KUTeg_013367 [Tegillarca granosa]